MDQDFDWDHLRSFLAVVREGGLSQAARALGLSQPSVGRHVDALEAQLGGVLFTRSRSGMTPTRLALQLMPHAEAMAASAAALRRAAGSGESQLGGPVRLTAPAVMAEAVLPPMLAAFAERHPAIEIELVSTNQPLNLLTREADLAVRTVRPEQLAVLARRVATVKLRLYAHRAYLARHGTPAGIDDLQCHRLIGYDRDPRILRLMAERGLPVTAETFSLRTDSETAQLAMLRAGYGIGGCQAPLAERDPDLVAVLPDLLDFELEVWLATHERLRNSPAVRVLMDHLGEGLAAYASA